MSRFRLAAGVRRKLPNYLGASLAAERTAIMRPDRALDANPRLTPPGRGIGIAGGVFEGLAGDWFSPARENSK